MPTTLELLKSIETTEEYYNHDTITGEEAIIRILSDMSFILARIVEELVEQ